MMDKTVKSFLAAVLVFLYLPIAVMIVMAFNRSSLYELPFTFDLVWFKALLSNDRLMQASWNSVWIATVNAVKAELQSINNGPARLLRNDNANQNDLLRVKTVGTRSNRDGIGAKVVVKTSKGRTLYAMVRTGSSYVSQSELPLTFGLGKPEEGITLTLEITWPGNQKETVANIKVNQLVIVQEGKGATTQEPIVFAR